MSLGEPDDTLEGNGWKVKIWRSGVNLVHINGTRAFAEMPEDIRRKVDEVNKAAANDTGGSFYSAWPPDHKKSTGQVAE